MQVTAQGAGRIAPLSARHPGPGPLWLHAPDCPQGRGASPCHCGPFEAVIVHLPCTADVSVPTTPQATLADRLACLLSRPVASAALPLASTEPAARRAFKGGLTGSTARRAQALLADCIGEPLSMGEIARRCSLSRSHFSKAFKQSTGLSPRDWQIEDRVRRAEALLRDPQIPIADVATQCGFADQSHLTRLFKRLRGITPARWRRRLNA